MSHAGDNRTVDSIFHVTNFFLFDQTHKQVNSIYPCPYTASLDDVKTSQTSFKFSRTIIMIIYPPEWDNRRMGHSEPGSVHWMYVSGPGTTDTGEGSGNILQLISDYESMRHCPFPCLFPSIPLTTFMTLSWGKVWPVFARPNGIISITLLVTAHYMGEIKSLDFSNTVYGSS